MTCIVQNSSGNTPDRFVELRVETLTRENDAKKKQKTTSYRQCVQQIERAIALGRQRVDFSKNLNRI
jgi:hypothetical protein